MCVGLTLDPPLFTSSRLSFLFKNISYKIGSCVGALFLYTDTFSVD